MTLANLGSLGNTPLQKDTFHICLNGIGILSFKDLKTGQNTIPSSRSILRFVIIEYTFCQSLVLNLLTRWFYLQGICLGKYLQNNQGQQNKQGNATLLLRIHSGDTFVRKEELHALQILKKRPNVTEAFAYLGYLDAFTCYLYAENPETTEFD